MAVSIHQLSYTKLSHIIFEWQAADKASLLALFIVLETSMHWFWCLFVWMFQGAYGDYVQMTLLYVMWAGITVFLAFFWWLVGYLSHIKNDSQRLYYWQVILIVSYSIYISVIILVMGYSSLMAGVSLVGGAMLGMMMIRRRYIWRAFLLQLFLIVLATIAPYFGIDLPNLRQINIAASPFHIHNHLNHNDTLNIENAIAVSIFHNNTLMLDDLHHLHQLSALFWRMTHMYFALPKAIFMVYVFRTLLLILDDSKEEILRHANQDELTKLHNRRYGLSQMIEAIINTETGQDYSVILLDLDLFKQVNDTHGHDVGDQVLCEVAYILSGAFTETQIISRYGGEEFLIALPGIDHHTAMTVAEQLRGDIAMHTVKVNAVTKFQMTASFGVYTLTYEELAKVIYDKKADKATYLTSKMERRQASADKAWEQTLTQLSTDICQRLISTADKALYEAKDLGRNQVISANTLIEYNVIEAPHFDSGLNDAKAQARSM